jgi:non-ribosomal peptide synthetase component E (peptide arylation enzyme)
MPSPSPIVKSEIPWLWERARREPDKLALLCGDEALSFAQLAERAELASARLAALGCGRGTELRS